MPPPLILSTLPPPLNAQPRPINAPSPLVHWRLSSHLPLVCWLVVALPIVACLCLASPFIAQPLHASILDPSSLFPPAGCCVASLHIASTSQRNTASCSQSPSPSPMRRHSCCQCAGVFAIVTFLIVTLVARCQAGLVALVVIVVVVNILVRPPILQLFARSTAPLMSISRIIGNFTLSPIDLRMCQTYNMS